jgi:pSer/pThr/pTyr-binding forkhead associated (FHA) protein
MAAIFILTKDRKQLARSTMAGNVFTMGRSKDCNLTLDEPLASREHVEVTLVDGRYWIRDCESTNGTLLNGVKLAGKQSLKDGDEIYVGATRIKFLVDNAALSEAAADDDPDKTRAAGQSNRDEKSGRKVNVRADRGQFHRGTVGRCVVSRLGWPIDHGSFIGESRRTGGRCGFHQACANRSKWERLYLGRP